MYTRERQKGAGGSELWVERQTNAGQPIEVAKTLAGDYIVSYVHLDANFVARPADSRELAQFLLIALTYQPRARRLSTPVRE